MVRGGQDVKSRLPATTLEKAFNVWAKRLSYCLCEDCRAVRTMEKHIRKLNRMIIKKDAEILALTRAATPYG